MATIGPSGRCAGGLAAANIVATIFGIFLLFFSFLVLFVSAVAKTPLGHNVGFLFLHGFPSHKNRRIPTKT